MLFPGQTLGGASDGKQKKFLSTFNDDPYQKYMQQMNIQPNSVGNDINQSVQDEQGTVPIIDDDTVDPTTNTNTDTNTKSYSTAPTLDELMGMSTSEIAGIFGGGSDAWMKKYGMYLPEYDPYQEQQREKEYGLTASGMRDEALIGKERIEGQFRSMASNFGENKMKDRLIGAMSNQFDLANIGKKQDIRGIQEGYYSNIMETMRYLGEKEAFNGGGGKQPINNGGDPSTWVGGNPGSYSKDDSGRTWYWDERGEFWTTKLNG